MQTASSRLKKPPAIHHQPPRVSLSAHLRYLPTLILSLPLYAGIYYLLVFVHPNAIRHFLIPNTYLPLLIVFFLANGFLASFLLLSTRRGFLLSTLLSTFLFLKLQSVELSAQLIITILIVFGIIEAGLTVVERTIHHANIRQGSH